MKSVVILVPTHNGQAGGEVYDLAVENSLKKLTKVKVIEVFSEVEAFKRWTAPFLRRFAFKAWFFESAMLAKYALAYMKYDGLILQNYNVCRYTWFLAMIRKLLGHKTITIVHHFEDGELTNPARQLSFRRKCIRHSDHILTISQFTKQEIIRSGYPSAQVTVIAPGTKRRKHSHNHPKIFSRDTKYILSVATVAPHKSFDVLVAAVDRSKFKNFNVIIAGSLDSHPTCVISLRSAIQAAGLGERVKLVGRVSEEALDDLLSTASIFVMPSIMEGYSMAVAEALKYGLPIITTTAGALPELVSDGIEGFLVTPGDPIDLSSKIDQMLTDSRLMQSCADAALKRSELLPTWDKTCLLFSNFFENYLLTKVC